MSTLALRTSLLVDARDARALNAACNSTADAVIIDLASPAAYADRANARRSANRAAEAFASAGRIVFARVSDARSGATEGDIQSIVRANLAAVVLAGTVEPQDSRAVDVAIRKQEMRRSIEPGTVRLIADIDSAAGLRLLPAIIEAIDRHSAVVLDVTALARDLGLLGAAAAHFNTLEHAMSELALTCTAAGIVWLLAAPGIDAGARAALATSAHAHGAAGVVVASDAEAQGFNRLFTPDPETVATARLVAAEWDALRKRGDESSVVAGHIVDRRTKNAARAVISRAEAIAVREKVAVR